jgi:hypothetical protein
VADLQRSGRPEISSVENVATVKMALEKSPQMSMRRLSAEMNISKTSCLKIARNVLGMDPYKISLLQELKPGDAEKRMKFAEWMLEFVNSDPSVLDHTFFEQR